MFRLLLALVIVAVSFLCAADALTNASIVKMVQDKISHDLIILAIKHDQVHFNIDSDSIALLTEVGVPEDVIKAMVVKQSDLVPFNQPTYSEDNSRSEEHTSE